MRSAGGRWSRGRSSPLRRPERSASWWCPRRTPISPPRCPTARAPRPSRCPTAPAAPCSPRLREVAPGLPVVVLSGDVPLVSSQAIQQLVDAHVASGAAATMATTILDDATGYGRVVRDPDTGHVVRVVETKAPGDATPEELQIREINTGIFCFDQAALADALPRVGTDNAQGEKYLPDVLTLLRDQGDVVAAHVVDDHALVLGVNDRVALAESPRSPSAGSSRTTCAPG